MATIGARALGSASPKGPSDTGPTSKRITAPTTKKTTANAIPPVTSAARLIWWALMYQVMNKFAFRNTGLARASPRSAAAIGGMRPNKGRHYEDEHRQLEGPGPPGASGRRPEPVAGRPERDQRKHRKLQGPVREERQVERPVVAPSTRDLGRSKRIRRFHVQVRELSDIYTG